MSPPPKPQKEAGTLTPVLERNIQALLARRLEEDRQRSFQDRLADTITRFTGSMRFVFIHLVLFGSWIIWNLPKVPLPKFDPSLVILAMAASVEAIFLSTFILITQNRITAQAEKRADLDLQMSLLAEHEITRLLGLVTAIADKLGIEESKAPDLEELKRDVAPEQVLDKLDSEYRNNEGRSGA